eukprot:2211-Heterococcus_DN1.PRE.4
MFIVSAAVSVLVYTASSQDSTGLSGTGTELTDTRVLRSAVQAPATASRYGAELSYDHLPISSSS